MDQLVSSGIIKSTSKDWLIAALDPMHDHQIERLSGWPDVETAPSIVRCLKQSVTISAPVSLTGPTWDCHVVMWPWPNEITFATPAVPVNNYITSNATPTVNTNNYGGLQAFACDPAINPAFVPGAASGIQSQRIGVLDVTNSSYFAGPSRLVGCGWEIQNSTAELYKQGNIMVYRLPNPHFEPQEFATVGLGSQTGQVFRPPPSSTASAFVIPGSQQWLASQGCYVVVPFVGQDNPPTQPDYVVPIIQQLQGVEQQLSQSSINKSIVANNTSPLLAPLAMNNGAGITCDQCCKILPIHQTGAILTGLSTQTSLTLNVRWYIETFPGLAEIDILPIATPSAEYDPRALELFSHCLRTLPVGVPFGQNPLGEWFAKTVRSIAEVAAPLASFIHPLLGTGVKAAGMLAGEYLAEEKEVKKVRKQIANRERAAGKPQPQRVIVRQAPAVAGPVPVMITGPTMSKAARRRQRRATMPPNSKR